MKKQLALATAIAASCAVSSVQADTIASYDWTGTFTMINPSGAALQNTDFAGNDTAGYQTELNGTMEFNFDTGAGTATVDPFDFFGGGPAVAYNINMQAIGAGDGANPGTLVYGTMAFDWSGNNGIAVEIVLDAGGFFTGNQGFNPDGTIAGAVSSGPGAVAPGYEPLCAFAIGPTCFVNLDAGPVLMATVDGNPFAEEDVTILNDAGELVFQGNRHTDGLSGIAMDNGPFPGFNANFDIRTMTLTGVEVTTIPVPAAVWLFGSGLLGLVGVARRKNQA